ncbi:MAG: hypothetical protein JWR07_2724 [Nevskia sp.]|nr:hypothetical protein [Nevskia sp.]
MEQAQKYAVTVDAEQVTLLQTVASVLSSFFGVQSSKHWRRDFTHGNASTFIMVGVVLAAGFVLTLLTVVKLILRHAGM